MSTTIAAGELHATYEAVVHAYLETDEDLADIADRFARTDSDVFGVMANLSRTIEESPLTHRDRLLAAADRVDLRQLPPSFAVLFASCWGDVLFEKGEIERYHSVLRFAGSLCRPDMDPRLTSEITMLTVFLPSRRGRDPQLLAVARQRMEAWQGRPRAWRVYRDTGWMLAVRGVREGLQEMQAWLATGATPQMQATIAWLDLVDANHRCDVARGRAAVTTIQALLDRDRTLIDGLGHGFRLYRHEHEVIAAILDGGEPERRIAEEKSWMPGLRDLLAGDLTSAVERARAISAEAAAASNEELDIALGSYQRIRAELAAGNRQAAARLLLRRHTRGTHHFIDDLFLARLEAAAGAWDDAQALMARAMAAADAQDSFGRVAFELACAHDLNRAQVAQLCRQERRTVRRPASIRTPKAPAVPRRGPDRLVGASPEARALRSQINQFAAAELPVLITGETGTGKELVARALHESGPRADKPFIAMNCAAVPANLFEDELFGHARGAFTGAAEARQGLFALAGEGTLFLDEIGELADDLQPKLLRVLENRQVRPIGASEPVDVRCRIVSATNQPLGERAAAGRFRQDLLFRLLALEITLPPLRERREDMLPLLRHFFATGSPAPVPELAPAFAAALRDDAWPGNVRELRHFVERLKILSADTRELTLDDYERARRSTTLPAGPASAGSRRATLAVADPGGRQPKFRRLENLRALFAQHRRLTRNEIAGLIGVADSTVGRDLKVLRANGVIRKVCPNSSPRSHYFEYVTPSD